jgi:hypothetical protein
MLHRINNNAAPNLAAHGTHRPPNAGIVSAGGCSPIVSPTPPEPEPAAILNISARGFELLTALQIRYSDDDNPIFTFDGDLDDLRAARAQSKEFRAQQLMEIPEIEGTLGHLVLTALTNTTMDIETAKKFKDELSYLIIGTYDGFGDPKECLDERVVNREKGLILAKYIAENYINEPDARQAFLDGVKQFADRAIVRDLNPEEVTYQRFSPTTVPGEGNAYNAAFKSVIKPMFGDDVNAFLRVFYEDDTLGKILMHEALKILFHDPKFLSDHPKYKEIADQFNAGEINAARASGDIHKIAVFGILEGDFRLAKKPSSTYYDDVESTKDALADTMERIRSTLNMDTIKESVMNIVRDILSNTSSRPGLLKNMLAQPSTP